jgi:hypothetical protein
MKETKSMLATTLPATVAWLLVVVSADAQGTKTEFTRLPPLESGNLESLYREDWQTRVFPMSSTEYSLK